MMLPLLLALVPTTAPITDLDLSKADQQWGTPMIGRAVSGKPLTIGSRIYKSGWGTHANSELIVALDKRGERFRADVGLDAGSDGVGSVRFQVVGDGKTLWESPILHRGDPTVPVDVNLSGVKVLLLRVDDAGDGNDHDHADWADANLTFSGKLPATLDHLPGRDRMINPGKRWLDTDGKPIQAHGGGVILVGKTYYWYGEEKSQGYNNKVGVACYSSRDLVHWKNEGVVLPASAFPPQFTDKGVCERPKVLHNLKTGKFVMWMHLDTNGYGTSEAGVAIADNPTGPFRFLSHFRPVPSSTYRDMNLFQDDDGRAYAFYSGEDNATTHVVRLNSEYTAPEMPMIEGQTWARILVQQWREASAPFKFGGKYYVITSACTGWAANEAGYAVADHILGPWTAVGNPTIGPGSRNTFGTQSTCVFPYRKGFVFMADRWNSANLADSRYVWLPFALENGKIGIAWQNAWRP